MIQAFEFGLISVKLVAKFQFFITAFQLYKLEKRVALLLKTNKT